jgi:hypothetical protein
MGAALAFVFSRFFPIEPAPPEAVEEVAAEPVDEETLAARKAAYRQGIYVFIGLAVLTAIEFGIALALEGSAALLFIAALAKAGLVIQYYMHLNNVWSEEEAH